VTLLVSRFKYRNVRAIRQALDRHNENCPVPAQAILLNPVDHALLGWDGLWGVPVMPDETVRVKRIRIQCDGSAANINSELHVYLRTDARLPAD
jgi:hypothetical protein